MRRRFENQCSYEWACTEKYEAATERLAARLCSIALPEGVTLELQRDPRGWPINLTVRGNLYALGG